MSKAVFVLVLLSTLVIFPNKGDAQSLQVAFCNQSEYDFNIASVRQNKSSNDYSWQTYGWTQIPSGRCYPYSSVDGQDWIGFTFSVGTDEQFQSFDVAPSSQVSGVGVRPNIPQFCVTTDGSEFAIASPNMRDVLKIDEYRTRPRPDLLKNCQSLNTTFVPVSFWVQALRSGEITINVWDVPEYVEPEAPSRFPADMDLSRWDGFIEACIPDLVNRYARIRENATVECTCFVTAVQLSVSPENLSYQYPKPLNIPFENLTEQERLAYSDLNFNCTDRTGNTDKDFDRLIAKLVAARSSETSVPQEELIVGQYSGISGYVNTNGPLEVLAIDRSSRAKNLKVGHFILQVEWQEVRNLKQLQEQIEAALARGKTSIRLSMQGDRGYYDQILEF